VIYQFVVTIEIDDGKIQPHSQESLRREVEQRLGAVFQDDEIDVQLYEG
jgi:hypothetical protein